LGTTRIIRPSPPLSKGLGVTLSVDSIQSGVSTVLDRQNDFQTVARVGDLSDGTGMPVEVNGRAIALFLDQGVYFAVDDQCPHQGAPLCDGIVLDRTVTCTWHGWRFSLEDGRWIDSPRIRIGTYPVRVEGDEIQVAVG
jgi:nitrite reductase (NADH) small subunit